MRRSGATWCFAILVLFGCGTQSSSPPADAPGGDGGSEGGDTTPEASTEAPDAGTPAADAGIIDAGTDGDAGVTVGACVSNVPTPQMKAPVVDVKAAFGAKGDGTTDDTAAIQSALDSMTGGGTLVFPRGTYIYGGAGVIHVRQAGVALWGYAGAELRSNNQDAQEIELAAPNTSIYGFLVTAPQFARLGAPNNHRIVLRSTGHEVIDNHVDGGAAAGIFSLGADHFLIARNVVENTEADSIHMTQDKQPSHDGRVLQNTVRAPGPYWGDDEIAVIGYLATGDTPDSMKNANYNILIECNDLANAGWGNGVDIGGGKDVTIRKNTISGMYHASAVRLGTEGSYPSYSTMNVLVENNTIRHIETTGTSKDGTRAQYGAFEVAARSPSSSVRQVLVRNNTVDDTIGFGVRFEGTLCDLGFENVAMTKLGVAAFGVAGNASVAPGCVVGCNGNTKDGAQASGGACNGTAMPIDVTGSSL
jgi:hypothetical protein